MVQNENIQLVYSLISEIVQTSVTFHFGFIAKFLVELKTPLKMMDLEDLCAGFSDAS